MLRKPLTSRKRAKTGFTAATRALIMARSQGRCEVCGFPAVHIHHRQLRRGKDDSASNALHLCAFHHEHIHAHPTLSVMQGHLVSQYQSPAHVPALLRGHCWCLLNGDGTVTRVDLPSPSA